MKAFLYELFLQFRLDIRSKALLLTCYVVPLFFFALMGGIFTAVDPGARLTLIPSMSVFIVSMGALIGLPPQLSEVYGGEIKKMYRAGGIPLYSGAITRFLSAFLHLSIVCLIVCAVAPAAFGAALPENLPRYFGVLALFLAASLAVGCVFGVFCKSPSKLAMYAQLVFLPSIMLSGIMFPASMLPDFLQYAGLLFPAAVAFRAMTDFRAWHVLALVCVFLACGGLTFFRLKKFSGE